MKRTDCCYKNRLERLNGIEERLNELKRKAAEADWLREERNKLRCKLTELRTKYNDDLECDSDSDENADQISGRFKIKKSESSLGKDQISCDENIMENIKQEFITQIRSLEEANQLLQDKVEHTINADDSADCLMIINEKLKSENEILQNELNNLNDRHKDMENDQSSMPRFDNVIEIEKLEYVTQIRNLEVANQLLNKKLDELAKNDSGSVGNRKLQQEKQILQNEFNELKGRFKSLAVKYENLEQQNSQLSLINKVILKESQYKLENLNLAAFELTTFSDQMIQIRNIAQQIDQDRPNARRPRSVTFSKNEETLRKSQRDEFYKVGTQRGSTEPSSRQCSVDLEVIETKGAFKIGSAQYWNALRILSEQTEGVTETSRKLEALKNRVKELGLKSLPPPSMSIWGPNLPVD